MGYRLKPRGMREPQYSRFCGAVTVHGNCTVNITVAQFNCAEIDKKTPLLYTHDGMLICGKFILYENENIKTEKYSVLI